MKKILVVGATGLTGRALTLALLSKGFAVRCSVRNIDRARRILPPECELVRGDITDVKSMVGAVDGVAAVYLCIHTLGPQPGAPKGQNFIDTELKGIENVIAACQKNNVRRILYVTFLGPAADAKTSWARGRYRAEQTLLLSGLDTTILRPGQIVGQGGLGFDMMMKQAKARIAFVMGGGGARRRNIALGDLVDYLVSAFDEPKTFGRAFDVGMDEVLTGDQMIDVAARLLKKAPPYKINLPIWLLRLFAPLLERAAKLPQGGFRDFLIGMDVDMVGDPSPIRAILQRPPLDYLDAVAAALKTSR